MTTGPPPSPTDLLTPATLAEVTQLWWFCDGAIMDVGTREHLHRSWGLCPRHAWLYFRAENELKYQPLGNAVLYEDLAGKAVGLLDSHHRPHAKWQRLAATDTCLTCDYLSTSPAGRDSFAQDMDAIRAGRRTRSWLTDSSDVWRGRLCPRCRAGLLGRDAAAAEPTDGVVCRPHLTAGPAAHDLAAWRDYLHVLGRRLAGCVKSMTADGPRRKADTDSALVEALGWFAGWPPPSEWTALRAPADPTA